VPQPSSGQDGFSRCKHCAGAEALPVAALIGTSELVP
jgi:hypothetical protein